MRAFLSSVALLALVACNSAPVQHLQTFSVVASEGASLTVGSGALAGTRLVIPPGALTGDVTLTVDEGATDLVGTPQKVAGPVAVWGPSGLHFAKPVQLVLPFTLGAGESTQQLFVGVWEENGAHTVVPRSALSVDVTNQVVQFSIQGFTSFQAGIDPATPTPDAGWADGGPMSCQSNADCSAGTVCVCGLCLPDTNPGDAGCSSDCRAVDACRPTPFCAPGEGVACDAATGNWICVGAIDAGPGPCGSNQDCPAGEVCLSGACVPDSDAGVCSPDCRLSNCGPPIGICPNGEGIVCDANTGNWACIGLDAGGWGTPDAGACTSNGQSCRLNADCSSPAVCFQNLCITCG